MAWARRCCSSCSRAVWRASWRAQLGQLGLERARPGDLARPRGGLLVEPARQLRGLLALAIALGAHPADVARDPRRRLECRALLAGAQALHLLLGAGDLTAQLGDLALGAQELLLVTLAHAALLLDAALQLLEELRADDVETVLLGQRLAQPLTQLRIAVVGSGWLVRLDRVRWVVEVGRRS